MKISFSGAYLMTFQNQAIKEKVMKLYNNRIFNNVKRNCNYIEDLDKNPIIVDALDNDVLILNNNDAKDYRELRKFNNTSEEYKHKPIIRETYLEGLMRASYIEKAQHLDLSEYSEDEILSGLNG